MNIQIVNETGCFMYLDEKGNYIDSFFIGQYWFDILSTQQKETLRDLLLKNNIEPFEVFYKDNNLYLTFINTNNNTECVYEIYSTGESKCFLQLDVLEIADENFIELHNFIK